MDSYKVVSKSIVMVTLSRIIYRDARVIREEHLKADSKRERAVVVVISDLHDDVYLVMLALCELNESDSSVNSDSEDFEPAGINIELVPGANRCIRLVVGMVEIS